LCNNTEDEYLGTVNTISASYSVAAGCDLE
jgi:hypothetical protein